jgi:hypothetical protein
MNDEAKAAKRYKVLMREKARLAKAGQVDADIDEELCKVTERFPSLAERPVPQLQPSTVAMLALGEAVAEEEKAAPASGAAVAEPAPAASEAIPEAPPKDVSLPRREESAADQKSTDQQPATVQRAKDFKVLLTIVAAASLALRLWNDLFLARPKIAAVSFMKCLSVAVLAALLHFFVLDRCGLGLLCDPFLYWAAINGQFILKTKAMSSTERLIVFLLRDSLGSFMGVLVAYTATDATMSLLGQRIRDTC